MIASLTGRMAMMVGAVLLAGGPFAAGQDKVEIPKAVMDTLKAKFPKAEVRRVTKEKEGDAVVYDIEVVVGGKKAEADIKEDGTLMNFEEEFAEKDLPAAVTKAVQKKYPGSKMKAVMKCTEVKDGKDTPGGFEIELETADKKDVEVTVAADGKILEDSTEKKDKK